MVGSEELAYDETLPDFRRLKLTDDGSCAGYLDGLHGPLLEASTLPYKLPLRLRQEAARPRRHPRQPYLYLDIIFQMPPTTRPASGAKISPLPS